MEAGNEGHDAIQPQASAEEAVSFFSETLHFLMGLLVVCIIIAGYHFFIAVPTFEQEQSYYVFDLDALMEAKAIQLITRERNNPTRSEEELYREADEFRTQLGDDLVELSKGAPIFQKGAVLRADSGIIDLTPILASRYGLVSE